MSKQQWGHGFYRGLKAAEKQFGLPFTTKGDVEIPDGLGPLQSQHKDYLASRNIDPEQAEELWDLQSIDSRPELIYIPITRFDKLVSWCARSIKAKHTSLGYIRARPDQESRPASKVLFGVDRVGNDSIVVVDDYFSVFRIGRGAVALGGKDYPTRSQVAEIAGYRRRYIVAVNTEESRDRAMKLCGELAVFDGKTYRVELHAKQMDQITPKEIRALRKLLK